MWAVRLYILFYLKHSCFSLNNSHIIVKIFLDAGAELMHR
jgi:hypothetical protein